MSIKYMERVWANKELHGGRLLLMLALADHANDAGECWPSQPHLADKARLTERQVRRLINALAADGYLAVIEKGKGRGKKSQYRLFPMPVGKADILSEEKRTFCPDDKTKADILSQKSGHLRQGKADILNGKADISDQNQSRVRSEPPIEPIPIEPTTESSSSTNDDEEDHHHHLSRRQDEFQAAWRETYGTAMPTDIARAIASELDTCSDAAIIHAIRASVNAASRSFKYLKSCAQNYIPPAPEPVPSYQPDIAPRPKPPVVAPSPAPLPTLPPDEHDPWAVILTELRWQLPADGPAHAWLEGSRLVHVGDVTGFPLYRVQLADAEGVGWVRDRLGVEIRKKLSVLLRQRV
jgi:hypothetical protein